MPVLTWKCGNCDYLRPGVYVKALPSPEEAEMETELQKRWKSEPCPRCGMVEAATRQLAEEAEAER